MTTKENIIDQKVKLYHSEEIMLILFICSTDLSNYKKEDLVCFAEDIEGRVDVLFAPDFLQTLSDRFIITQDTLKDFEHLKDLLVSLYSSSWHKKMQDRTIWGEVNQLSSNLLRKQNITWVEPNEYKDTHLEIDWT
jgi:hypothetical protein